MKNLNIGDLTVPIPIIQGGMGIGISLSGLASAVANMGGIGIIATVGLGVTSPDEVYPLTRKLNVDALRIEIRKARELSKGIIGVNIMVALSNYSDFVEVSIEEGVDLIFSGAGLPLDLPKFLPKGSKTKLVPITSSARAAKLICDKWMRNYNYVPDAIVVEGPMAGGHLGFKKDQIMDEQFKLEKIFPEVLDTVKSIEESCGQKIPVIAAGGIYTGADIHKYMKMGADGVQMGTRFVVTEECDAAEELKQSFLNATEKDVMIIKSPVGMPGRAIRNTFLKKVNNLERKPKNCPYLCIVTCDHKKSDFCIAQALLNAQKGKLDDALIFAGHNVHRVKEITTVKKLINELLDGYKQAEEKELMECAGK